MAGASPPPVLVGPEFAASLARTADLVWDASPEEGVLTRMHGAPELQQFALEHVADDLARRGLKPLFIDPPAGFRDTGPAALVDLASTMRRNGLVDGETANWGVVRRPWRDRVEEARGWLDRRPDEVVLLCADPTRWASGEALGDPFRARAAEAARMMVEQGRYRKLVTGALPGVAISTHDEALPSQHVPRAGDTDLGAWGPLAASANDLTEATTEFALSPPAQQRLLVAHAALLGVDDLLRSPQLLTGADVLADELARRLAETPNRRRVLIAWRRLALARRPFPDEWTETLLAPALGNVERAVIDLCVAPLTARGRLVSLPLRAAATRHAKRLKATQRHEREASRILFDLYHAAHEAAVSDGNPDALVLAVEAFHFAAELGDRNLADEVGPIFAEQLDGLGWILANRHGRAAQAADVFEASLDFEADAYSHHELAFNLDRLGRRATDVERHYRAATAMEPGNARYHGRLVAFFLVQGALEETRRAWQHALASVATQDQTEAGAFEDLHMVVAAVALRRAELGLARDALDAVPPWARARIRAYEPSTHKLEALSLARDGKAFVPLPRLRPGWWTSGPSLLPDRRDGRPRGRWLAGRIEAVDEDGVHVRAALVEERTTLVPPTVSTVIPLDRFQSLSEDVVAPDALERGRFVEVGLFGEDGPHGEQTIVRLVPDEPWDDLTAPELDTDRYLG